MRKIALTIILSALTISSCAPQYGPNRSGQSRGIAGTGIDKSDVGTVAGALGGALAAQGIGKGTGNTLAIAGGAMLGGLIGREVGASLDRADMQYYNSTTQNALEQTGTGTTSNWVNPDSGHGGTVTPTKTYQTSSGQYCREFTQTINIGSQKESAVGTACRQPDGTWKIVN